MDNMKNVLERIDINEKDHKDVKEKLKPETNFMYNLRPEDKELLRPVMYQASVPGKNIRQKLIEVLNYWMDVPKAKITKITKLIDMLHNLSLLIDDIQDHAHLRRGIPAAYTIFGITNVVNACTFLAHVVTANVVELNHPKALRIYFDAYLESCRGQGMELYWRENAICPTEKEYEQMALKKTGGIFFLVKNSMQMFTEKCLELDIFLTAVTLYFQINDDYKNLKSNLYFHNKGFCEDLTEGKFGYPTMHAVNSNPEIGTEIIKILQKRTTEVEEKKYCLTLIEQCGSFEYTRKRLKTLETIINEEFKKLEDNPVLNEFLLQFFSTQQ